MTDVLGDVSRETIERLKLFEALLLKWTRKINLIAQSTVDDVWSRHIVDSAQIYPTDPGDGWLDLGSGGGLPGLVCAIIAAEKHPDTQFTLVESDQRKCAFLRTAARELDLQVVIAAARIETFTVARSDTITARALKPLSQLIEWSEPHLSERGQCIFQKGRQFESEIIAAQQDWDFDLGLKPSITDPDSRILILRNIARAK